MGDKLKAFLQKKGLQKYVTKDNLVILVLAGILFLVISWPVEKEDAGRGTAKRIGITATDPLNPTVKDGDEEAGETGSENRLASDAPDYAHLESYARILEEHLSNLLEGIQGVGAVRVMITLSGGEERVVEKDRPANRSNTAENDSAGGSRSIYQVENREETVYITKGNEAEPYVIQVLTPKVAGVAVVAEGAGTGTVNKHITEAIQALFGLEAHKIKVIPGKEE